MYLSSTDIQQTRLHTIDNLHLASRAWVDATEKLAELTMRAGRQAFELERVVDMGHLVPRKLHVHNGADALNDLALSHFSILQSEFVASDVSR